MGLSSSQARLLHLTTRMHQIEYKAAKLEAEKLQMANESDRVYGEYLNALEATKIQYSTLNSDGSVTYVDATYNNLCVGYISNGTTTTTASPFYLGDGGSTPAITGTVSGLGYQLVDSETGRVYVPDYVKNIYNNAAGNRTKFANDMVSYVNGNAAVATDTTTGGTDTTTGGTDTTSGGDTVTPGGGDPTTTVGDETINPGGDTEIFLTRGNSQSDITIKNDPVTLKLHDTVTGREYTYTITSKTGGEAKINTIKFGLNGRLTINGSGLEISAEEGQDDNIILLGDNNCINTNSGNDTIRVGMVKDSDIAQQSDENIIMAGEGDDYIEIFGSASIHGADGNDTLLTAQGCPIEKEGIEITTELGKVGSYNGAIDQSIQGSLGNCRTLALINSYVSTLDLSSAESPVCIEDQGDKYVVKFKGFGEEGAFKGEYFEKYGDMYTGNIVTDTDIENYKGTYYQSGDLESVIISIAVNNMAQMLEDKTVETCSYNLLSKLLFGNNCVGLIENPTFDNLKALRDAGLLNQVIVGTSGDANTAEGIAPNHAYSIDSIDVGNNNITLVNPWDSNDKINISTSVFTQYFKACFVFGSEDHNDNQTYGNEMTTSNISLGANASNINYQYYLDLYDMLSSAGLNGIPAGMEHSTTWLANAISSGAVIKMPDGNGGWLETSVSTNTRLQEIKDESLLKKAEAKYEADMRKIDNKERKYDAELATFDNERNAIKQEMDTLKTVAKDNVDRTFKLFS